jgi:hypothetical protein
MVHFGVNRTSANRTAEIVDITDLPTLISASNGAISFGSPISEQLKQEIGFHHSSKLNEWIVWYVNPLWWCRTQAHIIPVKPTQPRSVLHINPHEK